MATRRLRIALWHHQRVLRRQALAQEGAAAHLMRLAKTLDALGRTEPARRLAGIALRFRVKAIRLTATAGAWNWRTGAWQALSRSVEPADR
jgi:hypothetical protein